VPNPHGELVSGVTSEITIPTPEQKAHLLSPAHLSLDDQGEIGVKAVTDNDTVKFHEVDIVRATAGGIWVTGLPNKIRIVTIGQGFVADGERVTPVLAERLSQAGDSPPGSRQQ